jgi:hypothetical protein
VKSGTIGKEKTSAAARRYIAAFLDANFRGRPLDSILSELPREYPDAVVTTQNQSLHGEAINHTAPAGGAEFVLEPAFP